jgi:four helix bundle protein
MTEIHQHNQLCSLRHLSLKQENLMGASFKQLVVWQRAVELSLAVYQLTAAFPSSEQFGLTSQLRRASVSIASNIAEGYGKSSKGEYILFLGHARGSLCELQTQIVIARSLQFGKAAQFQIVESLADEVSRMLTAILTKLKRT